MAHKRWQNIYNEKLVSAQEALSQISNGQTIFLGSGAGEPSVLTDTLSEMAPEFRDIEVIHLAATKKESNLARPELRNSFRYNTFYVGQGVSAIFSDGSTDYTPMDIRELPRAMANRIVHVDVALIQVSPPDSFGLCSLGVSVDATKAAMENADLVIAQVNEHMPVTMGDSMIPVDNISYLVEGTVPLIEVDPPELDPISLTIGRHVATLVTDGMTLHFDRSPISSATMRYLDTKKDLGIHTDILTDDILRLAKTQSVTNRLKRINKGRTTATMIMGSRELYDAANHNPYLEINPIDEVNDPFVIAQNDSVVSIHSVQEIELTGMARVDSALETRDSCLPSSMDFINGARRSYNGFTILALPSTSPDGTRSRIVPLSTGRGVFFARAKVDFVVTEYGVVNLYGLPIRERAIALIHIAHPKFRSQLLEEAKRLRFVDPDQVIPPEHGCVYPHRYEFTHTFKDGVEIFFRPVRPGDARRIQRMFYTMSPEDVRMRYHGTIKALSHDTAQRMAAVDYSQDMAIVGLVGHRANPKIVAEGRYMYNPANNMGEFDIVVDKEYRGLGVGKFLANYLNKTAYSRGLAGVYAEVIQRNDATIALLERAWPTAILGFESGSCTFTVTFPKDEDQHPKDSIVVYSGRFGDYSLGEQHPLDPLRARGTMRLMHREGYLDEPWMRVEEPVMIGKERLVESHNPGYIDALEEAGSLDWPALLARSGAPAPGGGVSEQSEDQAMMEKLLKYNLGGDECPIFPGLFDYVRLYSSATITGVNLLIDEGANVAFNPLGGFHHSSRAAAEGFCYVNDAIVAIDMFLSNGYKVCYIDIDAHHGNGVQDAYYRDDRVLTISLHESGKTLFPWSGFETEIGEDAGKGYNINVPLPEHTDDEAYEYVFDRVVTPAVDRFSPYAVVTVIGTDTHKSDPLSHLSLTNNGMVSAIKRIREYTKRLLLLGGGGYDRQSCRRGWARMWAAANRIDSYDYLLVMGGSFLDGSGVGGGGDLVDMAYRVSGDTKKAILDECDRIIAYHEENTIPLIGGGSLSMLKQPMGPAPTWRENATS